MHHRIIFNEIDGARIVRLTDNGEDIIYQRLDYHGRPINDTGLPTNCVHIYKSIKDARQRLDETHNFQNWKELCENTSVDVISL